MCRSNQGAFRGSLWEEAIAHRFRSSLILFEQEEDVRCSRMDDRENHVGYHDQALAAVLDSDPDMARRMAG